MENSFRWKKKSEGEDGTPRQHLGRSDRGAARSTRTLTSAQAPNIFYGNTFYIVLMILPERCPAYTAVTTSAHRPGWWRWHCADLDNVFRQPKTRMNDIVWLIWCLEEVWEPAESCCHAPSKTKPRESFETHPKHQPGVRWKMWHKVIGGPLTLVPDESWSVLEEKHPEMLHILQFPYNGEPPKCLITAKTITPNPLHFVRNHGEIPTLKLTGGNGKSKGSYGISSHSPLPTCRTKICSLALPKHVLSNAMALEELSKLLSMPAKVTKWSMLHGQKSHRNRGLHRHRPETRHQTLWSCQRWRTPWTLRRRQLLQTERGDELQRQRPRSRRSRSSSVGRWMAHHHPRFTTSNSYPFHGIHQRPLVEVAISCQGAR